jgi:hypothetical protein
MTEQEWLECTDPKPMLEFLRGKASDRKLRLFAVGCCRHIWRLLPDEHCRKALEVAERFADGMETEQDLRDAADTAFGSADAASTSGGGRYFAARCTFYAANLLAYDAAVGAARNLHTATVDAAGEEIADRVNASDAVNRYRKGLVEHIFGNPFRPVTVSPEWLTGNVVSLARSVYDDRAFDRMPELADALHAAGCDNDEILGHCRGPGHMCVGAGWFIWCWGRANAMTKVSR